MDNAGDYLLYIFLLVIGVVSSLSSTKKKKPIKNTVPQEVHPVHKRRRKTASSIPLERPSTSPFLAGETVDQREAPISSGNFADTSDGMQANISEEITAPVDMDLDSPEALRKAVIYAEILGRKY